MEHDTLNQANNRLRSAHARIDRAVENLTLTVNPGLAEEAARHVQAAATDLSNQIILGSDAVAASLVTSPADFMEWNGVLTESAEFTQNQATRLEKYGNRVSDVDLQKAAAYAQGSLDTATQVALEQRKRGIVQSLNGPLAEYAVEDARKIGLLVEGEAHAQGTVLTKTLQRHADDTHTIILETESGLLSAGRVDTENWKRLEKGEPALLVRVENGLYQVGGLKMEHENRLLQHHTITDAFLPVKDDATEKALAQAKAEIGEAGWKKGFTPESRDKTRVILKENSVKPEAEISGKLSHVAFAETQHGNQTFKKLRVTLENGSGGKTILSADLDKEFAQRLIAKLETAEKGQQVTIGSFAKIKEREGLADGTRRTFVDHVATLKDAEGKDIPAVAGRFREAQDIANAAIEPLKAAGLDNQEVFTKTASAAREKYFEGILKNLSAEKYPEVEQTAKMQQYPRLDGHLKEPDGTWRSVGFYVDKDNQPRAVVAIENKETGLKEKMSMQFAEKQSEKTGKAYLVGHAERADGSTVFVSVMPQEKGEDKWLSTSFSEKRGQEWAVIKGVGGTLKPNKALQDLGNDRNERTTTFIKDKLGVDVMAKTQEQSKVRSVGKELTL